MSATDLGSLHAGFADQNALCDQLDGWYDKNAPKGVIMSSSRYSSSPNSAIDIKNAGIVGLPLSTRDVDAVKQASHLAPFGKGTETLIDEDVRKTWEINAADISLRNPKWDKWVQSSILPICAEKMGIPLETRPFIGAELYKMLLYEEVYHFKPHRDSEKAPGMFATLAICFPSAHEGGQLVLQHGDEQLTWDSSKSSLADISVAAWYADVIHEVKPIISGHRLVLTYNVVNKQPAAGLPKASDVSKSDAGLAEILRRWDLHQMEGSQGPLDFLCYILEHQYTEDSFGLSRLVGKDLSLLTQTRRIAERENFAVFLATFEHKLWGGCDDSPTSGIHEEYDTHWKLQKMVDLEGNEVARNVDIDEGHIIQQWEQYEGQPEDQYFKGHTGNTRAEKTLWYRKVVMVLMPKSRWISFMTERIVQGSVSASHVAQQLLERYKQNPSDPLAHKELQNFCEEITSQLQINKVGSAKKPSRSFYGSERDKPTEEQKFPLSFKSLLIACCAWLGKNDLCEIVLWTIDGDVPVGMFKALRGPVWEAGKFSKFRNFLSTAIARKVSLTDTVNSLKCLMGTSNDSHEASAWCQAVVELKLNSQTTMSVADAGTLVSVCRQFGAIFYEF